MGSSEMEKTAKDKESKTPPPMSQEQSSTTSAGTNNPEWSTFQAYSPMPPHGFLASSAQAHPYMWGVQSLWMSTFVKMRSRQWRSLVAKAVGMKGASVGVWGVDSGCDESTDGYCYHETLHASKG